MRNLLCQKSVLGQPFERKCDSWTENINHVLILTGFQGEIFINDVKINKKTVLKLGDSLSFGKKLEGHKVNTRGSKRDKDAEKKKKDTKDEGKDERYDEVFLFKVKFALLLFSYFCILFMYTNADSYNS